MPKRGATVRRTAENEPVGPKMHTAVRLVAQSGPYASMNQLAKQVGPHGSQDYGYRIVNRCLQRDLLACLPTHDEATPQGRGAIGLTDKGARYLNSTTEMSLTPTNYADASRTRFDRKRRTND